ncbi:uncharacterized protein LOC134811665 [Bolinopsis microptera]|uniref:uncharacterized protein LOC134811665 n=1 Tax=Bolinopsis microptera TaxID=2820187 RepID=UPI00307AC177
MDVDNDGQFDDYAAPPDVFNNDFDTNLLTKMVSSDSTPYIANENSDTMYGNSKFDSGIKFDSGTFDSGTFARPKRNSQTIPDVKSVEPAEEFHDAHAPEREVVAITSDGHVDNLSKAATGSRIPAPARSNAIPTKLPSPKKHAEPTLTLNSNGLDNEKNNSVEVKEQNTAQSAIVISARCHPFNLLTYSEDQVEALINSARKQERDQWEADRRELELLVEEKTDAATNPASMGQNSDNGLELKIMSELNNEYAECMMAQSKRTEDILSKQIKKLSTDNSVLLKELDVMHSAMSDLHKRYDRARGIINQMKKREDTLEEEIRQCQEELRNSEENCRYISKTCDDKLEEANTRIDMIKQETEKGTIMMEASIKRLELECKSWHSKFLDKESSEKELIAICDSLMGVKEQEMDEEQ